MALFKTIYPYSNTSFLTDEERANQTPQEGDGVVTCEGTEYIVRHMPEHDGRVVSVDLKYLYLGDGDGYYYGQAIVVDDEGKPSTVKCGIGGRYGGDLCGSGVDASEELKAKYVGWVEAAKRSAAIDANNQRAYDVERGKWAYVTRGRKEKGRSGRIFWYGENRWGVSVGIEDAKGERFFTAIHNVDVVPDWEEAE